MVWSQLELEKPHIAYACVGIFSTIFSLVSLFVKEKLYIGEATVATIAGLILGPHCLDWFNPTSWGNTDYITLEICRIVLCIQIVAVAVELPRKYMKNHWLSVAILLLPVMTCGWIIVGLFIWVLIPHFDIQSALLVSACITATDPVLAAAVVGKSKFAERVPGHLRNLLTAESGCNDGMAFPFIYLSLNLVLYPGKGGEIVKDWILLTILWECFFGVFLGVLLGFSLKRAVAFAEKKKLIDRESFLAIFVFLAFNSAGIGSMLGVDDLLVSFSAGTAFGWNGDFAKKTEESHVSTVIDLLLNLAFFVYFGAIVPWPQFNNIELGLNVWRLIILAIVIIFLRRIPAVLALKPFTPDIKSWREALFCGHFGPIGVGAIFAAILARKELEAHYTSEETPLAVLPSKNFPHYQLLASLWPIVCFVVVTSIIVHGSSVAVLTLGKRLNRMAITMSFTTTNTQDQGPSWMSRLQKLDRVSTSFSLHRIDADSTNLEKEKVDLPQSNTIETSGIKVRPAGGAKRKKKKTKRRGPGSRIKKTLSKVATQDNELRPTMMTERQRPQTEFLQLGRTTSSKEANTSEVADNDSPATPTTAVDYRDDISDNSDQSMNLRDEKDEKLMFQVPLKKKVNEGSIPTTAFQEGDKIIIEDQNGEVVETLPIKPNDSKESRENGSIHSFDSLNRRLSQYSSISNASSIQSDNSNPTLDNRLSRTLSAASKKRAYYNKSDPQRKVFAHQVDDLILIENDDGEIIRRYKVNRHTKERGRSSSIVGKALSLVGIKGKEELAKEEQASEGGEQPSNVELQRLKDPAQGSTTKNPLKAPEIEKRIESKLNQILSKSHKSTVEGLVVDPTAIHPTFSFTRPNGREDAISEESEEFDDDSENSENSEDSENDEIDISQETNVERRRRLAALGKIPAFERDEDDEED